MAAQIQRMGRAVDCMPMARPAMMLGAEPRSDEWAMWVTGLPPLAQ